MRIEEKYTDQLLKTRNLLPEDIIEKLKKDSEYKHTTAYSLIQIAYLCGYDILNESESARYMEFVTSTKQTPTPYVEKLDKSVRTFRITKDLSYDKKHICIHKSMKNWRNGESYVDNFHEIDLEKEILNHTFPYELCQKRIDKQFRKKDVHTDLSIAHQQNAFYINKTRGFSLRPQSSIYVIDIDCDGSSVSKQKTDNTLNKIVDIHPSQSIIFIEKSYSGAYHVAIRFGDVNGISLSEFKKYIEHINKTILNSDQYAKVDTTSNGLRLLFSSTYYPIKYDHNYPHDFSEIYESIFDAIDDIKQKYSQTENIFFEYPISKEELIITNEVVQTPSKELFKGELKDSSIYSTRCNSNSIFKERIYEGHRWVVQKSLIPKMKSLLYTKEQVWSHLLSIDDGCRAGRENPEKWQKEVYAFYEKGYNTFIGHDSSHYVPEQYRPQFNHIPTNLKELISDEQFLNSVITYCTYKPSKRNREIFKTILLEIYGTFIYDTKNPKQLKEKQNPRFLIGSQFSLIMCSRMKEHFTILKHTDVYGLIRTILNCSFLFQEYNPFRKNYKSWIFISNNHKDNKCKQWLLNIHDVLKYSNMTIYNYITISINSFIKNIMNNEKIDKLLKILKHFNILKLFLSLDDNLDKKIDDFLFQESLRT